MRSETFRFCNPRQQDGSLALPGEKLMGSKVTRSPGADSSGIYRRPQLVLKLKRTEDLSSVLSKTKSYPTPIRMVGADYSQTRCVGGDGGTTVDTGALDKIVEFGENTVRAEDGEIRR